jgi:NACalpha-BTF3-like transcription factor
VSKGKSPLFELLDSINHSKKNILKDLGEHCYVPFSINKFLSGSMDTVIQASEMNIRPQLTKEMQYDYLQNSIRKKKRYTKWLKKESDEDIDLISKHYGYNYEKSRKALELLSKEEIESIKQLYFTGGIKR